VRFGLIACRGSSYYKTDVHGHGLGAHAAHGPEGGIPDGDSSSEKMEKDLESAHDHKHLDFSAAGQIIGVFILEFGVLLHRYDLP
jgi:zinc transporter 1/2/3